MADVDVYRSSLVSPQLSAAHLTSSEGDAPLDGCPHTRSEAVMPLTEGSDPLQSQDLAGALDLRAAELAAAALMRALGMDVTEPVLAQTPGRVARAYGDLLTPQEFTMTTFPNSGKYDELVVVRDIPFTSICEHHLLPFSGTAAVGYLPGERILGLSKLARVVELHARRPQVQERMTNQIAGWLDTHLEPRGTGVVLTAEHSCMTLRGVQARGSATTTSAHTGVVRTDHRTRSEFLTLALGNQGRR